ncbi:MAG: 50S ribosomal protein L35 [SAR324 cluster bacterium]|nr:50S ribosomal protein L35 [SAR324 cluster bacterium]
MAKYKMKTNRGAAKRFKINGSGKIKRKRAFLRHGMRKRNADNKRLLRQKTYVDKTNENLVIALLPNG